MKHFDYGDFSKETPFEWMKVSSGGMKTKSQSHHYLQETYVAKIPNGWILKEVWGNSYGEAGVNVSLQTIEDPEHRLTFTKVEK